MREELIIAKQSIVDMDEEMNELKDKLQVTWGDDDHVCVYMYVCVCVVSVCVCVYMCACV